MRDVTCPYCSTAQEINHDDGYGYSEDEEYEQDCVSCDKPFAFTTMIYFNYKVTCIGGHVLSNSERRPYFYTCDRCGYCEIKEKGE